MTTHCLQYDGTEIIGQGYNKNYHCVFCMKKFSAAPGELIAQEECEKGRIADAREAATLRKLTGPIAEKLTPEMLDPVNHPNHYTQGNVECIDAIEAATINLTGIEAVCTASAIKYLWRWKEKNGLQDLQKARWYLEKLIEKQAGVQ